MDPEFIVHTNKSYVKRFRLHGTTTTFKFNPVPGNVTEIDWLKKGFNNITEKIKLGASTSDQIGFTLKSLNLKNKEPGYVAFRPVIEIHDNILWEIFGGIIQSNSESITSMDTFQIDCTKVNLPVGSGRVRPGLFNSFSEESKARKGIVTINNDDNLCLPRALVVAKAHLKKDPLYELIRKDRRKRQTTKAHKLMAKARVVIPEEGGGIAELEQFQMHLKKYKITVYNYDRKGRDIYFEGPEASLKINLLFHNGHFNVITNLTAAFFCSYYCDACHIPFNNRGDHTCSEICISCKSMSPPCKLENNGISCPICNRHFKNQLCFISHQGNVCSTFKKCIDCNKIIGVRTSKKSKHICGEVYCKICGDFKPPNHKCYMQINSGKPLEKDFLFIFFDLETRQDDILENGSNVHKVNLCVSQQFCWQCIHGECCETCGNKTRIFNEDPIDGFMKYLLEIRKKFKKVCVIAHNGQGFDFQFIMKYIIENTKFSPETIMRGTKIILLEMDNIRFVDSLSYFPMALSELPKAFDLPQELKKGYFPHLFNTLENQNYVGPVPAKEYYCPDTMFQEGSERFEKWYQEQVITNVTFDFRKEILEYCISDVEILAQACLKFREMLIQECNVDPFFEAVTIASACNLAFRRNYLKENTIGIVPKNGYRLVDNQSAIALQWLSWEEQQRGIIIKHSGRDREIKIDGVKVDGFDGTRIYEFHGCYYHGCQKCYRYKREDPLIEDPTDSLQLRYEKTRNKIERLSLNYEVVEMWECEFKSIKKEKHLKYLENLPILNFIPLRPRDAFFGGRTGNTKIYHRCQEGETIRYVDVCSLYPYVCKYGKYPIGHPTIYVGDLECRERGLNVEGLLKCKILPPRELYHPVLPQKMNDKLMFVLCRTCGEQMNQGDCNHNSEERAITGTWVLDEIRIAVNKGYTILDMYELWEYEVASYEEGGLFTDFINTFLKLKQEATGYPSWCINNNDKERYINQYYEHEGIQLDANKIKKNPGLRSLSKLMLNSFWGKFGQRENQTKTSVIRDPKELFRLLSTPGIEVNCVKPINEEVVIVGWKHIDEVSETLRTANVVIAAYTTAQARIKLFKYLDALGEQVIYKDTDSTVYIHKEGLYSIPTGDFLGDMTDELVTYGDGSYIKEFVSGGPKTYAYIVYTPASNQTKEVCKVKGLTLNLKTGKKVNFETLKQMILNEISSPIEIEQNRIRRTEEKDVITVHEKKLFRITGPKRKRYGKYDTLPFGYKKIRRN